MKVVIVSGAGPWASWQENPSWLVASALDGRVRASTGRRVGRGICDDVCAPCPRLCGLIASLLGVLCSLGDRSVPCEGGATTDETGEELAAVVNLGLHGGASQVQYTTRALAVEREGVGMPRPRSLCVAHRATSWPAQIFVERVAVNIQNGQDNDGVVKVDGRIVKDGPFSLEATLPTRKLVEAMRQESIPAQLSYSVRQHHHPPSELARTNSSPDHVQDAAPTGAFTWRGGAGGLHPRAATALASRAAHPADDRGHAAAHADQGGRVRYPRAAVINCVGWRPVCRVTYVHHPHCLCPGSA
eukprot:scaffold269_cov404-Prasinococcus_capsulatus_cf.AAC.9